MVFIALFVLVLTVFEIFGLSRARSHYTHNASLILVFFLNKCICFLFSNCVE